ncbi:hypothetical protein [Streptomyces phaeochromogenes]
MVFGPDSYYRRPFNHIIATTILNETVPGFQPNDGIVLAEPGRSALVFPSADRLPTVLFNYRTNDDAQFRRPPVEFLRRPFGPELTGPLLQNLFQQFEKADDHSSTPRTRW